MKLKTKFQDEDFELGEVVDATISTTSLVDTHIKLKAKSKRGGEHMFAFSRISELFELFEDYEEPKAGYIIDPMEEDCVSADLGYAEPDIERAKELGIWLETKEEAEKTVEKLKAFKRLKDKGFKFELWDYDGGNYQERIKTGRILFRVKDYEENDTDLDLLFGGEE